MEERLFMDAVITPRRLPSRRGAIALIAVLTAINCATAAAFVVIGAASSPMFLGLDLIVVIVALMASQRSSTRSERVQVTAGEVRVLLQTPKGAQTIWTSPTAFTRVALEGEAQDEADLRLTLSGRELAVARALNRRERLDFAQALDAAIIRARQADGWAIP